MSRDWKVHPEMLEFVNEMILRFGTDVGFTAGEFLTRADELDSVADLVRVLEDKHGDSAALFAAGYFGGGGELPILRERL